MLTLVIVPTRSGSSQIVAESKVFAILRGVDRERVDSEAEHTRDAPLPAFRAMWAVGLVGVDQVVVGVVVVRPASLALLVRLFRDIVPNRSSTTTPLLVLGFSPRFQY